MTTTRVRAARRLCRFNRPRCDIPCEECLGDVDAVLDEIREPTPKMLKAMAAAMSPGKRPTQARVSCKAKHGIRWRAAIDAIKRGEG